MLLITVLIAALSPLKASFACKELNRIVQF